LDATSTPWTKSLACIQEEERLNYLFLKAAEDC
jgi:hypothetical protein